MAIVYLADYYTAPTAIVSLLREFDRSDFGLSIDDFVRDVAEWKHQRDAIARILDPRPRHLEPAFFDEPRIRIGPGRTPASPRACARSYPPPKRSFYQGNF